MANNKIVDREGLKAFREKLDDKYVIEGEYSPTTSVGLADEAENLTPYGENSGASDTSAFVMQTTGGNSDVGALAYQRKMFGNSVAWNQLVQNGNFAATDNWTVYGGSLSVSNNVGTLTISSAGSANRFQQNITPLANHKYLIRFDIKSSVVSYGYMHFGNDYTSNPFNISTSWTTKTFLLAPTQTTNPFRIYVNYGGLYLQNGDIVDVKNVNVFDLTLLGKEYDSVLAFNRDYPLPYYEYNSGTLLSSKTNGMLNVGYNAFDGEWEAGTIDSQGNNYSSTTAKRVPLNKAILVIPKQTYTFEVDNNGNHYIFEYDKNKNFILRTKYESSTYTNDITLTENTHYIRLVVSNAVNQCCFHLTWDGSRTGFEEHQKWQYTMPNVELRGGFDSQGNHWGDELTPDGTLTTGAGIVDLGTLTYSSSDSTGYFTVENFVSNYGAKSVASGTIANLKCIKYIADTSARVSGNNINKTIGINTTGTLVFCDLDLASKSGSQIKTALSGVYLIYELATPTTTQNDAYKYQESQQVDDFGTQQALSEQTIQVPQAFEFFYPVDYKAFIDSLGGRDDIEYDASEIVSHTELGVVDTKHDNLYAIMQENIGGALRHQLADKASIDFNNTAWVSFDNLTWNYESSNSRFVSSIISNLVVPTYGQTQPAPNIICAKYKTVNTYAIDQSSTNSVVSTNNASGQGRLFIKDTSLNGSVDNLKTAMKGIIFAYEKA